jgi:hypothetical protein
MSIDERAFSEAMAVPMLNALEAGEKWSEHIRRVVVAYEAAKETHQQEAEEHRCQYRDALDAAHKVFGAECEQMQKRLKVAEQPVELSEFLKWLDTELVCLNVIRGTTRYPNAASAPEDYLKGFGEACTSVGGSIEGLRESVKRKAQELKRESLEDEEEHLENCECCQNFMRMEAKYDALKRESGWQPMESAPTDGTHIIILTSDFGAVECYWDEKTIDFYKSKPTTAVYDPENMHGTWVTTNWVLSGSTDDDRRLICGMLPIGWIPKPPTNVIEGDAP